MPSVYRKVATALAKESAWQESHERRMQALRRLGLDVRADDSIESRSAEQVAKRLANDEAKWDPRAELLESARAGDRYAVARADALYGDSWRVTGVMRKVAKGG